MQGSSTTAIQASAFMIPAMGRESLTGEAVAARGHAAVPRSGADAAGSDDRDVVLVVDESIPIRAKLVEVIAKLGTAGGAILQATTPDEALAAFRRHHPSIVFTELIGIHAEDGLEVIHEMLETDPRARIVLVTAEPRDSAEVRAAIRAGVFAIVEKPVRYEKIRAVLADLEAEEGGVERLR